MLRSKFVKFLIMSILIGQVNFSPNFVSLLGFMTGNSSVLFYSNNLYFAQKEPIKVKIFETFECSGQNSSNSSCQLWNDNSIPLKILRHSLLSWQITPLRILKLILFQLWIKGSHQNPNFETFKCSGENLPCILHVIFQTTSLESNVK